MIRSASHALCGVLVILGSSAAAAATSAPPIALERFDPTPASDRNFGADGPGPAPLLRVAGKVTADWAHNPLVFQSVSSRQPAAWLVTHQILVNLGVSVEFLERFMVSLDLPLTVLQSGSEARLGGLELLPPAGFRLADLRVGARGLVWTWDPLLNLGLQGYLWIPTGGASTQSSTYTTDGHLRGRIELLLGGEGDLLFWSLALGPDFRRETQYFGETQGSSMRFNGAVGVRLISRLLRLGPEAYVAVPLRKPDRGNINAELLVGAHLDLPADFVVGAGAGPGLTNGIGTPDVRVVVTLATLNTLLETPAPAAPPTPPPPSPPPPAAAPAPPPPDTDGDGILDADDACPATPGIAAEDPNQRGCPPPPPPPAPVVVGSGDHDADGVADDVDVCPNLAGRPSPDRTKNGCPSGAVVGDQIVLLEPIMFATGSARILPQSDAILATAVASIRKLPADARVRVEGHTDSKGSRDSNRVLSEQRAQAVMAWFVAHGVEGERLSSRGFGPDTPISTNLTQAGRSVNRRVELHIEKPQQP